MSTATRALDAVSHSTASRKPLVVGGILLGGALAAFIGYQLIHKGGSGDGGGGIDGRNVGDAIGRRMIDHGDGTSEWARVTVPLLLGRQIGAAEGYATLGQAITAAAPNSGNGEVAFMREGAGVTAFKLDAPQLEAVESFHATAPAVVAYTTRMSGGVIAGPAATADERAVNGLIDAPA